MDVVDLHTHLFLAVAPLGLLAGQPVGDGAQGAALDPEDLLRAVDERVEGAGVGVEDEQETVDLPLRSHSYPSLVLSPEKTTQGSNAKKVPKRVFRKSVATPSARA